MICADCKYWTMGDTWGSPMGRDHGVVIESDILPRLKSWGS